MNHRRQDPTIPEDGFDEREWRLQERACREAPAGLASDDSVDAIQYRRIAEALRRPPTDGLPPEFAADLARRVAPGVLDAVSEWRFERILLRALVAAFALGALGVLGVYGTTLVAMARAAAGGNGLSWAVAVAACAGLSWAFDRLLRSIGRRQPLRHA